MKRFLAKTSKLAISFVADVTFRGLVFLK